MSIITKNIIDTNTNGGGGGSGIAVADLVAYHNLQSVSFRKFTITNAGTLVSNQSYRLNALSGFTTNLIDGSITATTGATGIFKEKFNATNIQGTLFKNTKRSINARITLLRNGSLGSNAELQLVIKRADNSIVPTYVRERITDTNSGGVSLIVLSYAIGDTDPYVVQGYYYEISNISNTDLAYDTIEIVQQVVDGV